MDSRKKLPFKSYGMKTMPTGNTSPILPPSSIIVYSVAVWKDLATKHMH